MGKWLCFGGGWENSWGCHMQWFIFVDFVAFVALIGLLLFDLLTPVQIDPSIYLAVCLYI